MQVRPFTLPELRCIYADSCGDTIWHPDNYPRTRPLVIPKAKGKDEKKAKGKEDKKKGA